MIKKLFQDDIKKIYLLLQNRQEELNGYYDIVKKSKADKNKEEFCDAFLNDAGIEITKETRVAALNRLVALREDSLLQELKKRDFSQKEIDTVLDKSYIWVKDFYINEHEKLLHKIESLKLLTPFYRLLLQGVHKIGKKMSLWQTKWHNYIIKGINRELYELFNGDEESIYRYLESEKLYEIDDEGKRCDRSYSVLRKNGDKYHTLTYKEAFEKEVQEVVDELNGLILKLSVLDDEIYNQKEEYLEYFKCLVRAFNECDKKEIVKRWQEVDRAWMKITTPFQVGHPLEYYEDHYRKAVALEWDIRLSNPKKQNSSKTKKRVEDIFLTLFKKLDRSGNFTTIKEATLKNLDKIQLYIGRPMLFYAAEFNGLFSAQVVPNDEKVSSEFGKKIFAFSDNVLESQKAKPTLKIHQLIFGDEFLKIETEIMFKRPEIWHKIYDITTIGHEFGHILWMDQESETVMNRTGNFKNIEEFKATSGGLCAFFSNSEKELEEYVIRDLVKRAVTLIAWMQTAEVQPYYCEGLIHLSLLFKSKVLDFKDKKLIIEISKESYKRAVKTYMETYELLSLHYLKKRDATIFLNSFAKKDERYFMPTDKKVKEFVEFYWNLYKEIGRVIA